MTPSEFEGGHLELMSPGKFKPINKVMQFVLHHF
jgi:hypothetical protein